MNILIPHHWLLTHLDTDATPPDIQEKLSLSGPSVERVYEREGDSVYDIEVTTNRVDSMSVRGIAREAAVILEQFGIRAGLKEPDYHQISLEPDLPESEQLPLPAIRNNPAVCGRIMAIVLKDVDRTPTPERMARRLRQVDMNIHDSIIDITNYITHEVGHPVHAFDYDKIMALGGEIIVKEAEAGKAFTTLDGLEYHTVGGEVVFENPDGVIIDLPSIKGTLNSSVDENTRNILLLIDSVEASKVRFASMTHQIRTVAAQLTEKNVDPHLALPTLQLGVKLYRELCLAQVASQLFDDFPHQREPEAVFLTFSRLEEYLGVALDPKRISDILVSLGCQLNERENGVEVQPPTYRPDLQIPADLIEEIARIYGYHNLPSQLMAGEIPLQLQDGVDFALEEKIAQFLSNIGWQEIYSYSLVSQELADQSGFAAADHLKLENPLTEDQVYLRRSLWPSLNRFLSENPAAAGVSVFEIANTYLPVAGDLPRHELRLGMVSAKPYRRVKGDLEALLRHLFLDELIVKPQEGVHRQEGDLFVKVGGREVLIGSIFILPRQRTGIDILISALSGAAAGYPRLVPLPKSAPVIEDMTFTLPEKTYAGQVLETIREQAGAIAKVELKDIFGQNFTFTLTYSSPNRAISSEEIKPIRQKIADTLLERYGAHLVGEV